MKTLTLLIILYPVMLFAQTVDKNGQLLYGFSAKTMGLNGKVSHILSYMQPNEQIGYESVTKFDSNGLITSGSSQSFQAGYSSPRLNTTYYQNAPILGILISNTYVNVATLQQAKAMFQFIWTESSSDNMVSYTGDSIFINKKASALLDTIQFYNKKNNFIQVHQNKSSRQQLDNYSMTIIERNQQKQVLNYRFYFADTTNVQTVYKWTYHYDKKGKLIEINYHTLKENQVRTEHYFRNKKTGVIDSISIKETKEATPYIEKYTYNSDGTIQKTETSEYTNYYKYDSFKNWIEQVREYKIPKEGYINRRTIHY